MIKPIRKNGFFTLHSNRSESLVNEVILWMKADPLAPLEEEVILVQSSGMGEWLKIQIARLGGVYASTRVEPPGQFLWRSFRQVLGSSEAVSVGSPLDKEPLVWRIMRLLDSELIDEPEFSPVKGFLKPETKSDDPAADEMNRKLQLAQRLAVLFDQYQVYRADWLDAWESGHDNLQEDKKIEENQKWQPQLWRALITDLDESAKASTRPKLQKRFIDLLNSGKPLSGKLPRRIIVFGVSHFPPSTLEALNALGQHSQVVLAILNPCRYDWGDIMSERAAFANNHRFQPIKNERMLSNVSLDDMHLYAHPLLAAWGRQGRDLIRQLDSFDSSIIEPQFLFDESTSSDDTLLRQVQRNIRDLVQLTEHHTTFNPADRSIVFHCAHSIVRELEILHDQLLNYFKQAQQTDEPLLPRDVVVMLPDIEHAAPAIRAIFGQYDRRDENGRVIDSRFIPFDIADLSPEASSPMIHAVQWLLRLPQQRCTMSELIGFLEVPAVCAKFGIDLKLLPKLTQWMEGVGIRWGLNEDHRETLGLSECKNQNSVLFGLDRMLLGFATGISESEFFSLDGNEIDPYAEVGGLEATLVGSLSHLVDVLIKLDDDAKTTKTPQEWVNHSRILLENLMKPVDDADRDVLRALDDALKAWQSNCTQAKFNSLVPLSVARVAWMEYLKEPKLNRRFRANGVTFCTMKPMRAIPFEVVCLLGMNNGDFPRQAMRSDFDLMAMPEFGRLGDRSDHDDGRQLMLDALLSSRRILHISWSGRNIRDNSEQPPSVLVSQLRDYLAAGWSHHEKLLEELTTEHPLQPFSRQYFEENSKLFTFAKEWRTAHDEQPDVDYGQYGEFSQFLPKPEMPLTFKLLNDFFRNPVKEFFKKRLDVVFAEDEEKNFDDECFEVGKLDEYKLVEFILKNRHSDSSADDINEYIERSLAKVQRSGQLPFGDIGVKKQGELGKSLTKMLECWIIELRNFSKTVESMQIKFSFDDCTVGDKKVDCYFEDRLENLRKNDDSGEVKWLALDPRNLCASKSPQIKPDKLVKYWIQSLAAACGDVHIDGVIVSRDATLKIFPMSKEDATNTIETMKMLFERWHEGMNSPLPLPQKTSIAEASISCLSDEIAPQGEPKAIYEKGFMGRSEVREPSLSREFPDFDSLNRTRKQDNPCTAELFITLAEKTYTPLFQWIESYVAVTTYKGEDLSQGEA